MFGIMRFVVTSSTSSMEATKSALTSGMHHSFFCHGLSSFFSDVCECLRVIWSPPDPVPQPCLTVVSTGRVRQVRCCKPGRSGVPHLSRSFGGLPGRGRSTTRPVVLLRKSAF